MSTALQPFDQAKAILQDASFKSQVQLALPKHMSADRMLRVALTAMLGNPKLLEAVSHQAGKASLVKALLTASQLGVEVDGRQAHLVPFNDKRLGMIVQLIVGYQGLVDKAYNHPKVKGIWWNVVYERDEFRFVDGLDRKLEHVKYDGEDDPGALRYAYAVCELDGGSKTFVCLNRREVMKSKSYSRGADSSFSPWQTNEPAMWGKTSVRALCKQIPQSNELRDALKVDDELSVDALDRSKFAEATFTAPKKLLKSAKATPEPEPTTPSDDGGVAPKEPAPGTQAPQPESSPQGELENLMTTSHVPFDDFRHYVGVKGLAKDTDSWTCYAEVPSNVIDKLTPKMQADCIRTYGKVQQQAA